MQVHLQYDDGGVDTYNNVLMIHREKGSLGEDRLVLTFRTFILSKYGVYDFWFNFDQ